MAKMQMHISFVVILEKSWSYIKCMEIQYFFNSFGSLMYLKDKIHGFLHIKNAKSRSMMRVSCLRNCLAIKVNRCKALSNKIL